MSAGSKTTDYQPKVVSPAQSDDGFAHLKQSRDAAHIRFYLWLYEAREDRINTCKLFWAYLFAPFALIFRAVVGAVTAASSVLPERTRKPKPVRAWDEPSKPEQFLDGASTKLSGVYAKVATPLKWIALTFAGLVALAAAIIIVVAVINNPTGLLVALALVAVCFAVVALVAFVFDFFTHGAGSKFGRLMVRLAKGFHTHTCAKIDLD